MRLLIRRPFRQEGKAATGAVEDDELESLTVCASLASSMVDAHQGVREDALRHCFPLCHYITSATMVMSGLVVREPALRRRYSDQMLAAARSLSTYCHTIWVSGKMMRWVSRLGAVVRGIHASGSPPATGDSRRQGQRGGDYNLDDGYPVDGMLQLTPESDILHPAQPGATERRTDGTLSSVNNGAHPTHDRASHGNGGTQQRVAQGAGLDYPADPSNTRGEPAFSNRWPMRGNDADRQMLEDLPGWAMTDFNFEDMDKGDELGFGVVGGGLLSAADTVDIGDVRGAEGMSESQCSAGGWLSGLEIGTDQTLSDLFGGAGGPDAGL